MWQYIIGGEYPLSQMSRTKPALELPRRKEFWNKVENLIPTNESTIKGIKKVS